MNVIIAPSPTPIQVASPESFLSMLSANLPITLLIIGLIVAAFVSILSLLWFIARKGGKFGVVEIASDKQKIDNYFDERILEYNQLRTLYDDQRDDVNRLIWDTEKNVLTDKYMNMVEAILKTATARFREVHENLVAKKIGTDKDISAHPDVRRYSYRIKNAYYELKDAFRNAMRKNGFLKMDTNQLHQYAMEKLRDLFTVVSELISEEYESEIINVIELREEHEKYKPEYGQLMMSIFIKAKQIAFDIDIELDILKKCKRLMQDTFIKNKEVITLEEAKRRYYSED